MPSWLYSWLVRDNPRRTFPHLMLAGPAVRADGTLKDASEMEWPHSRSPSPVPTNVSRAHTPLHDPVGASTPNAANAGASSMQQNPAPAPPLSPTRTPPLNPKKRKQSALTAAIMHKAKKCQDVYWSDKLMILDWMRTKKMSQSETARHWKQHGFPKLTQGTVSKWAKDEPAIRAHAKNPVESQFKRARLVENPLVEASLRRWCLDKLSRGVKLTGDVIIAKATAFETMHNPAILDEDRMSFSHGWLEKFKLRLGLKEFKSYGEAGSVKESDASAARRRLRKITDRYLLRNILNFDETGLNWRNAPDRGLALEASAGIKGDKTQLTYGFATNADGSWKMDPLIIAKAKNPVCFKKRSPSSLGFPLYYSNKKAWMTATIFME
jgi:hypothetical protein